MKSILFVDDEVQILKSLKRVFSKTKYKTYFSESVEDAFNILREYSVDMVITDMRMPVTDGMAFLGKIKDEFPDTIRMILSGYVDEAEISSALQSNLAKAYIFKPWNNEELIKIVEQNLGVS